MATKARGKMPKKRSQRATSNIFSMFGQSQIQEFREAFKLIDQNGDDIIDKDDLRDMLNSLGKEPAEDELESMIGEAVGQLNFAMFLTLFGEKLNGTDPEEVIQNAFGCFDPDGTGEVDEEYLREILTTMGDRFTDEQVDEIFKEAPIRNGRFKYQEFIKILKYGKKDKD